ncbi:MAG: PASTA domain-containing protein [Proteobacteria bacterium]|nr:PASTA domain-containing protein [Pseudomonadota bacterium]
MTVSTNASINTQSFVIDKASSLGIPPFTIAAGTPGASGTNVMNVLAARTGASFISAPSQAEVTNAYVTISNRLDNGYLLSFVSSITDCDQHTLSVTVAGQGTTETRFTRCDATTGPTTVPNVVNLTQAAATTALTGAGLVVGTVTQQSSATVAVGRVSSQNPASGVGVAAGSAVNPVISTGPVPAPGPVVVPSVLNLPQAAATTAINGAGLVLGTISQSSSTTVPAGSVISQNPNAGTSVVAGSAVSDCVDGSGGGPNVVNMTQAAATTAISFAGLAVGSLTQQTSDTVPSGSAISQNPAAGSNVVAGSAVGLVVSTGPAAPPPPPPPPPPANNGGGGGGSLGLGSLALGLAAMMTRRRRRT